MKQLKIFKNSISLNLASGELILTPCEKFNMYLLAITSFIE